MKKITLSLFVAAVIGAFSAAGCGSGNGGTRTMQPETTPPKNSFQGGIQNSNLPPQAKKALLGKH